MVDRLHSRLKWALSAVSAAATSALVLYIEAQG